MDGSNGGRTTMVLIHAFPLDGSMWEPQRQALAGRVDMYTPDLPGFGSMPGLDNQGFTMKLAARYLQRELDSRGIDRCILGGLSMGGYVAFECWRLFPERISGLVLADTLAAADTEERRRTRYESAEKIASGGYFEFIEKQLEVLLADETRSRNPALVDTVRTMMQRAIPDSVIAALLGLATRTDSTELLPTITVPTAIIFGSEDKIVAQGQRDVLKNGIADAEMTTIAGAGHLANLERPDEFNAALERLIERVEGGEPRREEVEEMSGS